MTFSPAPFFSDLAEGPQGARAYWVEAEDAMRLRIAHFPSEGTRGTILLFPGRTEYVEKYGRAATVLCAAGYHVLTIDWRGQGLAGRMLPDARVGHINEFADYQHDVRAMVALAHDLGLPARHHLIAHSMGGCIGLRALMEGLDVASAVFTGPMWGIRLTQPVRPVAWAVSRLSMSLGLSHHYAPGTGPVGYVIGNAFEDNTLTRDPEMWDYMHRHLIANPELQLGGPSLHWLHAALAETRALAARPSPDVPCLCYAGTNERIVDLDRIRDRMARWPAGRLMMVPEGEHEIMMEVPQTRDRVFAEMIDLFNGDESVSALTA